MFAKKTLYNKETDMKTVSGNKLKHAISQILQPSFCIKPPW